VHIASKNEGGKKIKLFSKFIGLDKAPLNIE